MRHFPLVIAHNLTFIWIPFGIYSIYSKFSIARIFYDIRNLVAAVHHHKYCIHLNPGIIIYDKYSSNLFHFYVDTLPKLAHLSKTAEDVLYFPSSFSTLPHIIFFSHIFGFKCIFLDVSKISFLLKARVIPHQSYSPLLLQSCRKQIYEKYEFASFPIQNPDSQIVFVSRSDAHRRRLLNEYELISSLSTKLDKELFTFVPSCNSIESQIQVFKSAQFVIGLHGAGLSNIFFCDEGAQVIELIPALSTNICYEYLSQSLGLIHHFARFKTPLEQDLLSDDFIINHQDMINIIDMIYSVVFAV